MRADDVILRRFDVDTGYVFESYAERQKLYLDRDAGACHANTEIWQDGVLQMRVNSLGCKGPEPEEGLPAIAFLGDSVTMCHCFTPDGWPLHVRIHGYTPLNAGLEGADMAWVLRRWQGLREEADVAAVVAYVGWHNLIYNRTDEAYWEECLTGFLGDHVTAVCTIASCLTDEFRTRRFDDLLAREVDPFAQHPDRVAASLDGDYFNFWADLDPEEHLDPLLDAIARYNAFVSEFARRSGALLIDLGAFLRPARYEDAPSDFYDVCHLRPRAYGKIGGFVAGALAPELSARPRRRRAWQKRRPRRASTTAGRPSYLDPLTSGASRGRVRTRYVVGRNVRLERDELVRLVTDAATGEEVPCTEVWRGETLLVRTADAVGSPVSPVAVEDPRKNIYPLW